MNILIARANENDLSVPLSHRFSIRYTFRAYTYTTRYIRHRLTDIEAINQVDNM